MSTTTWANPEENRASATPESTYPPSGVATIELKFNPPLLLATAFGNDRAVSVNSSLHCAAPVSESLIMRPLIGPVSSGCPNPAAMYPPSEVGLALTPEPKKLVRSSCQTIVPELLNLASQAQGWQNGVELSSPERIKPPSAVDLTKFAHCSAVAQLEYNFRKTLPPLGVTAMSQAPPKNHL